MESTLENVNRARMWVTRVGAAASLLLEQQDELDELSTRKHFALASSQRLLENKLSIDMVNLTKAYELTLATLWQWTHRTDMSGVQSLLIDVQVRIANAYDRYEEWRKAVSTIELLDRVSGYTSDVTRETVTERAAYLEREFQTQVELLWETIPVEPAQQG